MRWLLTFVLILSLQLVAWGAPLSSSPRDGEITKVLRPHITVYLPLGAGLPHQDAQMWIDGQEVSDLLHRTSAFVSYQPRQDLTAGAHSVRFLVANQELQWNFQVEAPPARIRSLTWKGPRLLKEFDEVEVELSAAPALRASFQVEGVSPNIAMKEVKPGIYQGKFQVPASLAKINGRLIGTVRGNDFQETKVAEEKLKFSTTGFRVLVTGPDPAQPTQGNFLLEGRTRPNVRVEIKSRYDFLDGLEVVDKSGPLPKPTDHKVTADAQGRFQLEIVRPPHKAKLTVTLQIEAVDAEGNRSTPLLLHYVMHEKESGPIYPRWN